VVIPVLIYHGNKLRPFVPDMQVAFVDLGGVSEEAFPAAPELLARLHTFELVRTAELTFDAIVAIFRHLRLWRENHSQMEAMIERSRRAVDVNRPVPPW
jgi:hypothetical protein